MPMALAEKILSQKVGREVKPGEIVISPVDWTVVQDGTGPLTFDMIRALKGKDFAHNPSHAILTIDHTGPSPRADLSNFQVALRKFSEATGAIVEDVGQGISHLLLAERYVGPGDVVVGADSHTSTAGGLAAFATGMGSTDAAIAMSLGKMWFRTPETTRLELKGKFPDGVYSKDLILHIIGTIGEEGGLYRSLEYGGEALPDLSMDARFTMTSMAQELGAKLGLMPSDEVTKQHLEHHGRVDQWIALDADPGASYEKTMEIQLDKLEPFMAVPHQPGNVKTAREVEKEGIAVDQVFIGTCTNGRLDDLRAAARVLEGRQVHKKTRCLIIPGSQHVYREALREGLIESFVDAGAVVGSVGCGPCPGIHMGVLGDGEVCVAAQNRNFKGRLGNPKAFVYLASPITAAATAVEGKIADPRRFL